jgi:hypothetical protein
MQDQTPENPFEAEQIRRQKALDDAEAQRMLALADEQDSPPVFDKDAFLKDWHDRAERISEKTEDEARRRLYEIPNELPKDRIGGWTPGAHPAETHEALVFEIEADRALFMGKPAPKDPDPDLQALHQELHQLHSTFQRTGDRSLLLPIADLTARYNALLPKPPVRTDKPPRPGGGLLRNIHPN